MIEDRELDTWREQWGSVAEPLPEMQHQIQRKIKRQNMRFVLSNLVAAIAFVAVLIVGVAVVRQEASRWRVGGAVGMIIFVSVCAAYRLWVQRGTWRPETESTCAFVELWHGRVVARIRLLRLASYLVPGWIVFCAALAIVNWTTIVPEIKAHPGRWLAELIAILLFLAAAMFWLVWYRRHNRAELNEVKRILDEMKN